MAFNAFPLELKQAIWEFALPKDEPEVCIIWPLNQLGMTTAVEPLLVDIAFPVLMHVCREWREFVLLASHLKLRLSRQAGCKVPYRSFRPDIDTLYCSQSSFEEALQCFGPDLEPGIKYITLATVRFIAVDWDIWMTASRWLPQYIFRANQNLEKVSIVFPSSRKVLWSPFQAPARRCRLRHIENPGDVVVEKEGKPEKVPENTTLQYFLDYGTVTMDTESWNTWESEIAWYDHTTDWFTGSAWDPVTQKVVVEREAAAFIQYKRSEDGMELWEEACENRLLDRAQDQYPPAVRVLGNPEEYRVNDDDDYIY